MYKTRAESPMPFSAILASTHIRRNEEQCYGLGVAIAIIVGLVIAAAIATGLWHAPRPGWNGHMLHLSDNMQQVDQQVYVTVAEIQRVRNLRGSCNLLIFGVGFDSIFWTNVNVGGHTVFLEDNAQWATYVKEQAPHINVYQVVYHTQVGRDDKLYLSPDSWPNLTMQVYGLNASIDITTTTWDVVIVDGPGGFGKGEPGRIQPLYTAIELARPPNTLTVVDDCEREVVRTYADLFYGPGALFLAVPRAPRFVPSLYNPVYGGNLQCFYRH